MQDNTRKNANRPTSTISAPAQSRSRRKQRHDSEGTRSANIKHRKLKEKSTAICAYHSFYGLNKSPQQINTRGWSAHLYPTSRWCGTTFWLHTIDWGENDSLIIIVPVFFILCSQIPANVLMLRARALGENIFAMKRSSGDDGNEKEKTPQS